MTKTILRRIKVSFNTTVLDLWYKFLNIILSWVVKLLIYSVVIFVAYFELAFLAIMIILIAFLFAKCQLIRRLYINYFHYTPIMISFSGFLIFCGVIILNIILMMINMILSMMLLFYDLLHMEQFIMFIIDTLIFVLTGMGNWFELLFNTMNHTLNNNMSHSNIFVLGIGENESANHLFTAIGRADYYKNVEAASLEYRVFIQDETKEYANSEIRFDRIMEVVNPQQFLEEYGPRFPRLHTTNFPSPNDLAMKVFIQEVFTKHIYGGPFTKGNMVLFEVNQHPNISAAQWSELIFKGHIRIPNVEKLTDFDYKELYNMVDPLRGSVVIKDIFGDTQIETRPDSRGFYQKVIEFFSYYFHYFFDKNEQNKSQHQPENRTYIFENRLKSLSCYRTYIDSIKSTLYSVNIGRLLEIVDMNTNIKKGNVVGVNKETFLLNTPEYKDSIKVLKTFNTFQEKYRIDPGYEASILFEVESSQGTLISMSTVKGLNTLGALEQIDRLEHMKLYNKDLYKILYIDKGLMCSIKKE